VDADNTTTQAFWQNYEADIARLFGPLSPDDGIADDELTMAEQRLGLRLPRLLREFYLRAGGREDLNKSHERLLEPNDLLIQDDVLVFYEENQAVVLWGIAVSDIAESDPLVREAANSDSDPLQWSEFCSLSKFLRYMLYWQGVCGGMPCTGVAEASTETVQRVELLWPYVPLAGDEESGLRLYSTGGQAFAFFSVATRAHRKRAICMSVLKANKSYST
jgi:hypothetical protein